MPGVFFAEKLFGNIVFIKELELNMILFAKTQDGYALLKISSVGFLPKFKMIDYFLEQEVKIKISAPSTFGCVADITMESGEKKYELKMLGGSLLSKEMEKENLQTLLPNIPKELLQK